MEATLDREEFQKVVTSCKKLGDNIKLQVAEGGELSAMATDFATTARATMNGVACLPGEAVVSSKLIASAIGACKGEKIDLSLKSKGLVLNTNHSEFVVPVVAPESFPDIKITKPLAHHITKADAEELRVAFSRVLYAVSKDTSRRNMMGVHVSDSGNGGMRLAASDGHRLAIIYLDAPYTADKPATIPAEAVESLLAAIKKLSGEVTFGWLVNECWFSFDGYELATRYIEDGFPAVDQVIPKDKDIKGEVLMPRSEMIDALGRIATFQAANNDRCVVANFDKEVTLETGKGEIGSGKMVVDLEEPAQPFEVGLNAAYLSEALSRIESAYVKLRFIDDLSPILLEPQSGDDRHVVMPMRLK